MNFRDLGETRSALRRMAAVALAASCLLVSVPRPLGPGLALGAEPTAFERSVWPRFERAASGPARLAAATNWPAWFEKNTTVTDKKTYVHFFWNAQDQRARFQGPEREPLIAEAARQLVVRLCPKNAPSDRMKIDIVFVSERDGYGMPKWDTLQRVAHLECSKQKPLATPGAAATTGPPAPPAELRKAFDRFELY